MKIGLALSGCDLGGLSAYTVLELLEKRGYEIPIISSCCMPTVTAAMSSSGLERDKIYKAASDFLLRAREDDVYSAAEMAAELFHCDLLSKNKNLAVNSVNVADGKIITFTNAFTLDTEKLRTFPLCDACDALSSTISLMDGLGSYHYKDCRLCDFSVWYGCPLYPLKMSGISKTVSVSFLPASPKTPYEALVRQITAQSAKKADVHIPIEFPSSLKTMDEMIELATAQIEKFMTKIYWRTLF